MMSVNFMKQLQEDIMHCKTALSHKQDLSKFPPNLLKDNM